MRRPRSGAPTSSIPDDVIPIPDLSFQVDEPCDAVQDLANLFARQAFVVGGIQDQLNQSVRDFDAEVGLGLPPPATDPDGIRFQHTKAGGVPGGDWLLECVWLV